MRHESVAEKRREIKGSHHLEGEKHEKRKKRKQAYE